MLRYIAPDSLARYPTDWLDNTVNYVVASLEFAGELFGNGEPVLFDKGRSAQ